MTTTPTVEEFLAQQDPDEEPETEHPMDHPLNLIAESLRRMADAAERGTSEQCEHAEDLADTVRLLDETREERDDWEDKHRAALDLIHEIGVIVKPSTSKVSLEVKAAIERWANPVMPEPVPAAEMGLQHPVHDAPVEAWREFARAQGYADPPPGGDGVDVDSMNRSQIRTLLGIPHTTQED